MNKGIILLVASSADQFELKAGKVIPAGFYLNELCVPIMTAVQAGYDFVLATPKGTKPVMDKRSADTSHFNGDEAALRAALDFVEKDPRMVAPSTLRSVIEEGLDGYVGMFIPGGHPPMVDLMQDPDVGEILRHFHEHAKPTAMLCHGPISVTAAMPKAKAFRAAMANRDIEGAKRAAQGWQYSGYKRPFSLIRRRRSPKTSISKAISSFTQPMRSRLRVASSSTMMVCSWPTWCAIVN
jgi:putative intracellular protease/amidase